MYPDPEIRFVKEDERYRKACTMVSYPAGIEKLLNWVLENAAIEIRSHTSSNPSAGTITLRRSPVQLVFVPASAQRPAFWPGNIFRYILAEAYCDFHTN